ncbi:transposable element Tcb2 transposase [Trichonephila clavipes]|nr:transposable element Tcb2 transposase [Trichonephila clavipes]
MPNEDRYIWQLLPKETDGTQHQICLFISSAIGMTFSRQTIYRCLRHIGLYDRRPVRCVPLTSTHCRLRLTRCRDHALWTPQQWSCVMFSDESRISLQSDSRRTLMRRVPGTKKIPLNDTVTVVPDGSFGEELFLDPELICMFRVDDNAHPQRANIVEECLKLEDIIRMDWPAYLPDLNPIDRVWDMLVRRIAARQPPLSCLPELQRALADEWWE